ncbi:MAG TPA: GNAT family N-acetyltransferase [Streptosporangiaceae bacterium]|nr:GNAT family N-acetyltransferase [Streptosporangiaceae bacterium]
MTGNGQVSVQVRPGVAELWPELAADGPLLTKLSWLELRSASFGDQMITLVVTEDGEAKLAALATVLRKPAPGELYDLHHVVVSPAPVLPLTDAARAARTELMATAPPPERWVPCLIVMLPGYECVPVGPGRADPALLGELVSGAVAWAGEQDLPTVAFLYTHADPPGLDQALARHGFTALSLSRTWVLPVPAGGTPEYLAMLAPKRRSEAAREMRRLADAGVSIRQLDPCELGAEATLTAMAALRARNVRKYHGRAAEARELAKLQRVITDVCDGQPRVFVAEAAGGMVGFTLFCAHGDCWYGLSGGHDYSAASSRFCYFATSFYAPVPAAAQAGVRSLAFGQGSAGAKRSRGCVGLPLAGWILSAERDLRAAVQASAAITELDA